MDSFIEKKYTIYLINNITRFNKRILYYIFKIKYFTYIIKSYSFILPYNQKNLLTLNNSINFEKNILNFKNVDAR